MRRLRVLALLAASLESSSAFTPLERRPDERSWTPARETGRTEERLGWSPKPTEAPIPPPRYGQIDLIKRDFTMGTDTCGFVSGFSSAAVTCVRQSAYCTNDGAGNMDCCTGEYSLCTSSMFSSCLDFSASQRGACSGKGPRTICCWAESPSCYTLIYSTTASPGRVFSILQCQASGGLDSLLATPPNLSGTTTTPGRSSSTSTSPTSTSTVTVSSSGDSGGNNGGQTASGSSSSTPVGAIVGGVVGGIAAIGLIAFLIFWLLLRSRRDKIPQPVPPIGAKPEMAQGGTPQTGFTSPGLSAGQYTPGQQDYKPFPDAAALGGYPQGQTQGQMGGYLQHQQQQPPGYGYGHQGQAPGSGYPQSGSTSPGMGMYGQQGFAQPPQQVANELPVHYALGSEGHRAELGQG